MNGRELRNKTIAELREELEGLQREQFNLRMQKGVGQAPRTDRFGEVRRDIARVKTVINEKTRAANADAGESA